MSFPAAPTGEKRRDYWWTVLATDPLAVPLTRWLAARRAVTPDQVTIVALLLGLAVGPLFALGSRAGLIAGGLVFHLAFVADCVDGKLARSLQKSSARGQALDHLADGGRRASASLGLAVFLWRSDAYEPVTVWFVIVYAILAYYFLEISGAEKRPPAEAGLKGRAARALARRRLLPNPGMPDVQAIVFILGPIFGLVVPALVLGTLMVVAGFTLTVVRRLR